MTLTLTLFFIVCVRSLFFLQDSQYRSYKTGSFTCTCSTTTVSPETTPSEKFSCLFVRCGFFLSLLYLFYLVYTFFSVSFLSRSLRELANGSQIALLRISFLRTKASAARRILSLIMGFRRGEGSSRILAGIRFSDDAHELEGFKVRGM